MTTRVSFWLSTTRPDGRGALQRAQKEVQEFEARFSRFRADSELSTLNNHAGTGPVGVSNELFQLVEAALKLAHRSGGLVDPTVLPALVRQGYGTGPSLGPCNYRVVHLDKERQTVDLPPGYALDLGGVAKGWLAVKLAQKLGRLGPCLVDVGGELQAHGSDTWMVEIENPLAPHERLLEFPLAGRGVATSSVLKRRWSKGRHHLIDPRTGRPAQSDLVSVTVVSESALTAEGDAKTVLLLGRRRGSQWLSERGLAGVMVGWNAKVWKVGQI